MVVFSPPKAPCRDRSLASRGQDFLSYGWGTTFFGWGLWAFVEGLSRGHPVRLARGWRTDLGDFPECSGGASSETVARSKLPVRVPAIVALVLRHFLKEGDLPVYPPAQNQR